MKAITYDPRKNNEFSNWYYQKIKSSREEKDKLVKDNPILALRVFNVFNDEDIGGMFITAYRSHPQLSHVAYLVAEDLGHDYAQEYLRAHANEHEIERLAEYDRRRKWVAENQSNLNLNGNGVPGTNYRRENQWDNFVRALEEIE